MKVYVINYVTCRKYKKCSFRKLYNCIIRERERVRSSLEKEYGEPTIRGKERKGFNGFKQRKDDTVNSNIK